MNKEKANYNFQDELEDTINLRDELEKYAVNWKWFVLSAFLCFILGYVYLRYSTPMYKVTSTILIKDDDNSFSSELSAFQDLGLFGNGGSNIQNEIQMLKSRNLALDVIKELDLDISYFGEGKIKESELYGKRLPVKLLKAGGDAMNHKIDTTFFINIKSAMDFELLDEDRNFVMTKSFNEIFLIDSIGFKFENKLSKSSNVFDSNEIKINISSIENTVNSVVSKISIEPVDPQSSVLELSMLYPVKQKAIDVLNTLVEKYNEDAINDKSKVGFSTSVFIQKRLEIIEKDLNIVDKEVEGYKKENKLTDLQEEAKSFFSTVKESDKQLFDVTTQMKLVEFMDDYVSNQNSLDLIPANLGFSDPSISILTQSYNALLLEKEKILNGSTEENPLIGNFDRQLKSYRKSLKESLTNLKSALEIQLKELNIQDSRINAELATLPKKEREFKDILRQQSIKEELYLYLLQKREETEISLAVTTSNSKVVDFAYASQSPVAPKRKIILLASLLLGLLIPFSSIYVKDLLDTKLHTRKDLEQNVKNAPILGDIPINDSNENIVVKEGGRSSTSEAFRLLRTNLDFILTGVESNCKSIFVTSTTSGEGKSFVSVNLACTLALSGKKVALLGLDLRAPKITEYLSIPNNKGVTNYIKDNSLKITDLKFNIEDFPNMDIYSSGIIPPNPAELLLNSRVDEMFETLKSTYDYIVVDTAPVNLVTDTLLVSKYADMFIYVARAGYLDKRLLAIPENLYADRRLPNMAMLINASDYKKSYGYGAYGAYGYGEADVLPWWKRIFS